VKRKILPYRNFCTNYLYNYIGFLSVPFAGVKLHGDFLAETGLSAVGYTAAVLANIFAAIALFPIFLGEELGCYCDKVNAVLTEHNLGIKSRLQIIPAYLGHILNKNVCNLARFNISHKFFPSGTVKIFAAPPVVRIVDTVGISLLFSVIFEVLFLMIDLQPKCNRIYKKLRSISSVISAKDDPLPVHFQE